MNHLGFCQGRFRSIFVLRTDTLHLVCRDAKAQIVFLHGIVRATKRPRRACGWCRAQQAQGRELRHGCRSTCIFMTVLTYERGTSTNHRLRGLNASVFARCQLWLGRSWVGTHLLSVLKPSKVTIEGQPSIPTHEKSAIFWVRSMFSYNILPVFLMGCLALRLI